jgi:hypothetical protein
MNTANEKQLSCRRSPGRPTLSAGVQFRAIGAMGHAGGDISNRPLARGSGTT